MGKNRPQQMLWPIFHDALHGPPTSRVPPGLACEVGGVLMAEPTSLNRGEGLAAGWLVEVEDPICGGWRWWWVEMVVKRRERMSEIQP